MPAVPKCQIRLKWLDKQTNPEELIYCLNLIGAQKPRNYINITFEPDLDPGKHTLSRTCFYVFTWERLLKIELKLRQQLTNH